VAGLRRWAWGAVALAAAGAAWFTADWYRAQDVLLSQEPARKAARLALPARDSEVAVRLRVPFELLQQAAEQALPREFSHAGEGDGTRYQFKIRRTGAIALSEAAGRLRARVSLAVNGDGGLSGGLAEFLALGTKNFDAEADVQADLTVGLDGNWCPVIGMKVDYAWTRSPRLEVIGGVWVGIEKQVREIVDAALLDLPEQLRQAVPCARVRRQIEQVWRNYDIPVQLPAAPPLVVHVSPRDIGTSGVSVQPDHLSLVLALKAQTGVLSSAAGLAPAGPLPPMRDVPDTAGRLRLSVPVRAGYDMIRDWMVKEFGGRDIPLAVAGWQAKLRVREITVYPSDPAITVAVTFNAELPGRVLNTTGRIVLSARPVVEQNGTRVRLTDIRFVRDFDNLLWSVATAAFAEQIRARLREVAVYDLRDIIADALGVLRKTLADPDRTGGVRLALTRPSLRLDRLVMEADALTVLGVAEASVEAELTALPGQ
jgi:hypothetical protein